MLEMLVKCPRCGREKIRVAVGCKNLMDVQKKKVGATCYKCARQFKVYGPETNRVVKILRVLSDKKYKVEMTHLIRERNKTIQKKTAS